MLIRTCCKLGAVVASLPFVRTPEELTTEFRSRGLKVTPQRQLLFRLLHGNMRLRSDGWGMVNAAGCSEVGFWPLYFGDDYFILIVSGMPRFNQEAFTTLVWALGVRYGRTSI